jgi:hypothetical protein
MIRCASGRGVWSDLVRSELRNCCRDFAHERRQVRRATARLRQRRHVLRMWSTRCAYSV